jgi:hypothetical protein
VRRQLLRIASGLPKGDKTRRSLLAALRLAREEQGSGGLLFTFEPNDFSVRTFPTDPPYNQTYTTSYLSERGPKRAYRVALEVVQEFKADIMRFKQLRQVREFVDNKVAETVKRGAPKWGTFHSPD